MLKEASLPEAQITDPNYREAAELVMLILKLRSTRSILYEKILLQN